MELEARPRAEDSIRFRFLRDLLAKPVEQATVARETGATHRALLVLHNI